MNKRSGQAAFLSSETLAAVVAGYFIIAFTLSLIAQVNGAPSVALAIGLFNIVSLPLAMWGVSAYRSNWREKQTTLNQDIDEVVRAGDYALYLRPFVTSGQLKAPNAWPHIGQRALLGDPWDLELAFGTVLGNEMPLVAIGETRSGVGAGKVHVSDDIWQETMLRLAQNARLIIAVPLDRPSTLWEIEELAEKAALRDKTVFVMPPSSHFYDALLWPFRRSVAARWRRSTRALREKGISLPRYRHRGGFFVMGEGGVSSGLAGLRDFRPAYVEALLKGASEPRVDRVAWFNAKYAGFRPHMPRFITGLSLYGNFNPYAFKLLALFLLASLSIRWAAYQPFRVPSASMAPTIIVGDYILASKFAYGYSRFSAAPFQDFLPRGRLFSNSPERGDIVIFRPLHDPNRDFLKRIVGMPGDRIQMIAGELHINGVPCPRERTAQAQLEADGMTLSVYRETLPNGVSYLTYDAGETSLDETRVFVVPDAHYFVLGDHRDNSEDSRSFMGAVPADSLVGRVEMTLVSWDVTVSSLAPWTLVTGFRPQRSFRTVR